MTTDRLEHEQAPNTIAQLRQQQRQLQRAEQESHLAQQAAARLTQHIAQLDKQIADMASTNDELSTDLAQALDVAKRVMDQKSKLQEQCQSQEQQLMQWQLEVQRVKEQGRPFALLLSCRLIAMLLSLCIEVVAFGLLSSNACHHYYGTNVVLCVMGHVSAVCDKSVG